MNSNEKGFSTPLALTVIFSLCIIALSFCMVTSATEKQINSYDKAVKNKKQISSYRIHMSWGAMYNMVTI